MTMTVDVDAGKSVFDDLTANQTSDPTISMKMMTLTMMMTSMMMIVAVMMTMIALMTMMAVMKTMTENTLMVMLR